MRKKKGGGSGDGPPRRFPPPLIECKSKERIEKLFRETVVVSRQEREQWEKLKKRKGNIFAEYADFNPHERAFFFSLLYDQFAQTYDSHMGQETGHYEAMRDVLSFSSRYLRAPLLDITAGTGEMLLFALELASLGNSLRSHDMKPWQKVACRLLPEMGLGSVVANEISPGMLEIARRKLHGYDIAYTTYNALGLPENWQFRTVLCSQTMHLLAEADKKLFVQSIHRALVPGGHAVVIEEDPFYVTPTPAIDGVGLFIRAVACPIKPRVLIGHFETNGFEKMERRAAHPIDENHVMRVHIFQKSP